MKASRAATAEQVWLLLQRFVEEHSRHTAMAEALGFSLGGGRGRVLSRLRTGPLALTDLAAATGFDAPYTTTVVDKLQAHGLVERRPHPDDGRRKLVRLTPAGEQALATVDAIRRRPPEPLATTSVADLERLAALLTPLLDEA